LAIEKLKNYK